MAVTAGRIQGEVSFLLHTAFCPAPLPLGPQKERSKRGQRNAKGHPRRPFLTAEAKGPGRVCGDHPALWSDLATFVYLFEKES